MALVNWSSAEVTEIVAAYFDMLDLELAGTPYKKTTFNSRVQTQTGRSKGSVDFKFQNVSAVMQQLGFRWLTGYRPAKNAQTRAIIKAIDEILGPDPNRAKRFKVAILPQSQSPSADTPSPNLIDAAPASAESSGTSTQRLPASVLRQVTAEHIWRAVERLRIEQPAHPFGPSTDFDVLLDDGTRLPPKAVFGLAATEALGYEVGPYQFTGGRGQLSTEAILGAGFRIVGKNESPPQVSTPPAPDDKAWSEGDPRLVSHLKRERASGLAAAKKAEFVRVHGHLFCELCKMDPREVFGGVEGDACIEVHHAVTAVADMISGHTTSLNDVQCLCANCHRVVHRRIKDGLAGSP